MKNFIKLFILLFAITFTSTSCVKTIESTEVGIRFKKHGLTDQGEVSAEPVSGWAWYNPFTEALYTLDATQQNVDYEPFTVTAKGGGIFTVNTEYSYQIIRADGVLIFKNHHNKPLEDVVSGNLYKIMFNEYKDILGTYTPEEITNKMVEIENIVEVKIKEKYVAEGFQVITFASKITPPKSLSDMIDLKNETTQAALRAEESVKTEEAQAKIAIAKAKGIADAAIAEAEGKARARKIEADAEAYYNQRVGASLNSSLLKKQAQDKWDGKYPTHMLGNSTPLISM